MLPELSAGPSGGFPGPGSVREMLTMASAAASIVTTRKGALRSMPDPEEIEAVAGTSHAMLGRNVL